MATYTNLSINPKGNLVISLTVLGKERLDELEAMGINDEDALIELLEDHLCNGYSTVPPENIGALTNSLIIADCLIHEETTQEELDKTNAWWFPDYQVKSYTDALKMADEIVFQKAA